MSAAQQLHLRALCAAAGVPFDPAWRTAADAAAQIEALQQRIGGGKAAPAAVSATSAAGEEDPGAGLDMPAPPNPAA